MPTMLSPHFSLEEFITSSTAARNHIDNTPTPEVIEALRALVVNVVEPIRILLGVPIRIDSGYRCAALNKLVGGQPTSQHQANGGKEAAADLVAPSMTAPELATAIMGLKTLPFDQLLLEFYTPSLPHSGWVHVSYTGARIPRRMVLTIDKHGTRSGLDSME